MIVTPYFYPKVGGLEKYALNIAKGLKRQGNDILIVTSNHDGNRRVEEKVHGLHVIRLPRLLKLSNTPINPAWHWQLKKIIRAEKPDVINAHTPVPFMADMAERARARVPFVLTYHNDLVKPSPLSNSLAKAYSLFFTKRTLRRSDSIIATSQYYANTSPYLKRWKSKISIVSPGVDLNRFNDKIDKQWLKKQYPGKKLVLFVGSMEKTHAHKGVDVLIKALAQVSKAVPDVQLVAVGTGDAVARYKTLASKLGVENKISFPGFVAEKNLPEYYAGAEVFVLPSTSEAEGFGMVLAEAQACGTAVIGSDVGGIPFVVNHKQTGILVKPNSVKALSDAINQVLKNNSLRKQLSEKGYAQAHAELSWEISYNKTLNILKRTSMPRICLIHNIISPYRLPVFEILNKNSNLTVIFCKAITKDRVWEYNLDKYTFKYKILRGFSLGPLIININSLVSIISGKFDAIIYNNDPDVATAVLPGLAVAKLMSAKKINWSEVIDDDVHTLDILKKKQNMIYKPLIRITRSMIERYRKFVIHSADQHVAFSKGAREYLLSKDVPKERITLTRIAMPVELLPAAPKSAYRKRNGKRLLYLGYLNQRKNVSLLIRTFKEIDDQRLSLTIVGSGPCRADLVKEAKTDRRISFLNYVEGSEKAEVYASSDIFVLPTTSDVWGLVINEAMHYGLAVICSDAAEVKEIIGSKSGYIFESNNASQLQTTLKTLVATKSKVKAMQSFNAKRRDIPTADGMADAILNATRKAYAAKP